MARPTADRHIEGLEELRRIAAHYPMKAVEAFMGRVLSDSRPENKKAPAIV